MQLSNQGYCGPGDAESSGPVSLLYTEGWGIPVLQTGRSLGPHRYRIVTHNPEARRHRDPSEDGVCWGSFDLYFILDMSGSVDDNWINVLSFVPELVARFKNPDLRMSFIIGSRDAEVIVPLTADRDKINNGFNRLQSVLPGGYTYMQKGFEKANKQIMKSHFGGEKVASVIIMLTRGRLRKDSFEETKEEADKSRHLGAIVYTVGVLDYDKDQMVALADTPGHMFAVHNGFQGLRDILDLLVSKSCLEVTSVEPSNLCVGEPYTVVIRGQGFRNAKDPDQVICRFKFGDTIFERKPTSVEEASITCPGPRIDEPGWKLPVDLSLNNGTSFIGNKFKITSTNCVNPTSRPVSGGGSQIKPYLKFLPALLLIPLLLCCCWGLWWRKLKPPPAPRPQMEPEREKLLPPPPPPYTPSRQPPPPPPPPPINTRPTVIVPRCGCRKARTIKGNLGSSCNCGYPSCHQMPRTWCQPRTGRYTNSTLISPHCEQASRDQKICRQPSRKSNHLTQPPCMPSICLPHSRKCVSMPEIPCSPRMHLSPSQENVPLSLCTQCHHLPARRSKCPPRILPLLSPLARKRAESPGHSHLHCPISNGTKTCD